MQIHKLGNYISLEREWLKFEKALSLLVLFSVKCHKVLSMLDICTEESWLSEPL